MDKSDIIIIGVIIVVKIFDVTVTQIVAKKKGIRFGWLWGLIFGFVLFMAAEIRGSDEYVKNVSTRPGQLKGAGKNPWNEETQWYCAKCKKILDKRNKTCSCGYTLEEYLKKDKDARTEKYLAELGENALYATEEERAKLEKYRHFNFDSSEIRIAQILEGHRYSSDEIKERLDDVEDKTLYMQALNHLVIMKHVEKDSLGRYFLTLK